MSERVLAWGGPRPRVPTGLAGELRAHLESGIAEVAASLRAPRTRALRVTRWAVDRAVCDGLQLEPEPFRHTAAISRGLLAREAVLRDWERERRDDPERVVAAVWHEAASRRPGDPRSLSSWLNQLEPAAAARLAAEVTDLLHTFREVWPWLPSELVATELGRTRELTLSGGAVVVRGGVDLAIDSHHDDGRARTLIVDLKSGRPRPERDRRHARFAALMTTLAVGRPPFRWVTYHLPEGRAELEDLDAGALHTTVEAIVATVAQLVRLDGVPPGVPDERLRLAAGAWCPDCRRREDCSERLGSASS